jgi:hypothetical protein
MVFRRLGKRHPSIPGTFAGSYGAWFVSVHHDVQSFCFLLGRPRRRSFRSPGSLNQSPNCAAIPCLLRLARQIFAVGLK